MNIFARKLFCGDLYRDNNAEFPFTFSGNASPVQILGKTLRSRNSEQNFKERATPDWSGAMISIFVINKNAFTLRQLCEENLNYYPRV